ncbi:MAG: hypothetical protein IJ600_05565 [Lachnospiraceae bacterium]|nr:hypothetical protein [Lachnospiraceae bacterium]
MADLMLNEEQKEKLEQLRRMMGNGQGIENKESEKRLYRQLENLEDANGKEVQDTQKQEQSKEALLRELKAFISGMGSDHALYQYALDALRAIAPELAAQARQEVEKAEERKAAEMEERVQLAKERADDHLGFLKDDDGNGIPDFLEHGDKDGKEAEEEEKEGAEKQGEGLLSKMGDAIKGMLQPEDHGRAAFAQAGAEKPEGRRKVDLNELSADTKPERRSAVRQESRSAAEQMKKEEKGRVL